MFTVHTFYLDCSLLTWLFCFARLLKLQHAPNKPNFTKSVHQIFGCQTTHCVQGGASAIIDQPRCEILPPPHKDRFKDSCLRTKLKAHPLRLLYPGSTGSTSSTGSSVPSSLGVTILCKVLSSVQPLHYIVQALCNHCIALYCTGIVQGHSCALCIPHLMISCGSTSPSIRKLQYEVTIAIAWLSHFLLEQLSLPTSLFSFSSIVSLSIYDVGIFVVISLSVGLDDVS